MSTTMTLVAARPAVGRPVLVGSLAILMFFGGLGGWAATAPLSAAAHASGKVRVESYRKTVQHLEGGIIREILVQDGDLVQAGQALVRLDDVQAAANSSVLQGQYDALLVLRARLEAERDGLTIMRLPAELDGRTNSPDLAKTIDNEQRLFESRRVLERGKVEVLRQQIAQLGWESDSYRAQITAAQTQIDIVGQQLATARDLVEKGASPKGSLLAIEKELAELQGARGQQEALLARTQQSVGEAQLQILEIGNTRMDDASNAVRDAQAKIFETADRLRAATDVQKRTTVVAPQSGRVMSLRQFTVGGVVRPGDPILDIVPDDGRFVVEVNVSTNDIDTVRPGLDAEVKFAAFNQRTLPILLGTVRTVSADAVLDQRTGVSYYTADVTLPPEALAALGETQLYPGMSADVMIRTKERTVLDYFLEPLQDSFRRALREQ